MKSVMKHQWDIPQAEIPRSSFDRSHGYKTTFDVGRLVPFYVDEALPGDTFNLRTAAFARLATPIKPIMDNMRMDFFFFSVPIRQLWDNWEKFNGEQKAPGDSTDFVIPQTYVPPNTQIENGTLYDYLGLPTNVDNAEQWSFNSLFVRAYRHIYNEWFRDQNHEASWPLGDQNNEKGDGPDPLNGNEYVFLRRKRPDYFTSCLPWPQKGDPVTVSLGDTAPVISTGDHRPLFRQQGSTSPVDLGWVGDDLADTRAAWSIPANATGFRWARWDDPKLVADLSNAVGVQINDLREAFQVQKILERDARGGTRYPEILKAHFGVTDPQMLVLQRPEYLGGGSTPININPVTQNTPTNVVPDVTPQGNLAAYGTASANGIGFTKSFTEHCIVMGIVNVRADLTYQQGLERQFNRLTRFDFYWPALSHLGEQAVLNKEIYLSGDAGVDNDVFGYQERYGEYRQKQSKITGKFRSTDPESLDVWHLSEEFADTPVLGVPFLKDQTPIDRVVAVPTEPDFLFDAYISLRCARPMPMYGVPGMIDHF